MIKAGGWRYVGLLWTLVLLASCGIRTRSDAATNQDAIVGQEVVTAQFSPVQLASALEQQQAVQKAEGFTPHAGAAGAVTASLVALTVRDTHGQIIWNMQSRSVWLVLFKGVQYQPASAPDAGCACSQYGIRPNTAVALDPHKGSLVLAYGYGS